jgi:hypothetical protein
MNMIDLNRPIRISSWNGMWFFAVICLYLIGRFVRKYFGPLEFTGVYIGVIIGIIWAVVTLIRAYMKAKKGIFAENQTGENKKWRLIYILIEILSPIITGYFLLLYENTRIQGMKFSDAVISMMLFIFLVYLFISSIGYYFLEWVFGKIFYDRENKEIAN